MSRSRQGQNNPIARLHSKSETHSKASKSSFSLELPLDYSRFSRSTDFASRLLAMLQVVRPSKARIVHLFFSNAWFILPVWQRLYLNKPDIQVPVAFLGLVHDLRLKVVYYKNFHEYFNLADLQWAFDHYKRQLAVQRRAGMPFLKSGIFFHRKSLEMKNYQEFTTIFYLNLNWRK